MDEVAGLFGPGSMVWRIDRELAVLAGSGSRALLMQVAHPLVAAAVANHSRYRSDPLGRLRDTLVAIYGFAFGDKQRVEEVVSGIRRLHTAVRGTAPDGREYSALDPTLLLWVYATLIDSSMLAYETFVKRLTDEEREACYAEFRRAGPVWGIPPDLLPPTLAALRAWMAGLIDTGEVRVTEQGRFVGRFILQPKVWWLPPPVALPLQLVTAGLLPPQLRTGFGYTWGPRREACLRAIATASRAVVPRLPPLLRDLPVARAADRRVSGRTSGALDLVRRSAGR
jgi:uncharacterized protein (DUF2236 family)